MIPTRHASSERSLRVLSIGQEREPVVIIDGATGIAEQLRDFAATKAHFVTAGDVGSGYPGLVAAAPHAYLAGLVDMMMLLVAEHFHEEPVDALHVRGNFSLVTTCPESLSPLQRVPHVDAADRLQFAAVHFLSDTKEGTGFFRHRATGFETIDKVRLPLYNAALDDELAARMPEGYPQGEDGLFDRTGFVEPRLDRLVVYRAALLHSALITAIGPDAADSRRGRLTGNLFLRCRLAA